MSTLDEFEDGALAVQLQQRNYLTSWRLGTGARLMKGAPRYCCGAMVHVEVLSGGSGLPLVHFSTRQGSCRMRSMPATT